MYETNASRLRRVVIFSVRFYDTPLWNGKYVKDIKKTREVDNQD